MASGFTNRGKYRTLQMVFNNGTEPATVYCYLITISGTPTADTNTWSDLSTNNAANYTPIQLTLNSTDFPNIAEVDASDWATVGIKDIVFTASGGSCSAAWCIITDDNGTEANRDVLMYLDLGGTQTFSSGQTLTVTGTVLKLT